MAAQNLGRANVGRGKKKPDPRVEMMKQLVKDDFGKDVPQIYRCTRCGFTTTNELAKFSNVYSQIYASNDFRLSVCKNCLDDLYEKYYRPKCESDEEAVRVLCQKFDIYYNPSIVQMMKEGARPNKHFSFYVQKTSLQQYANKTYDTTIQEEKELSANVDMWRGLLAIISTLRQCRVYLKIYVSLNFRYLKAYRTEKRLTLCTDR